MYVRTILERAGLLRAFRLVCRFAMSLLPPVLKAQLLVAGGVRLCTIGGVVIDNLKR